MNYTSILEGQRLIGHPVKRKNRPEGTNLGIAVHFEIMDSCGMIPYNHVQRHERFGGTCCLHLQDGILISKLSQTRQYIIWERDGWGQGSEHLNGHTWP
jgi:hypothetical protein